VLAARSEQQLTRAILQVQLHGAKADTKYLGLIKAPFIGGGSDRHVGEVSTDVAAGSKRGGRPIIGQLTARPGDYRLTMTLDAIQGGDAVSRAAPSSDCFLSPSMRREKSSCGRVICSSPSPMVSRRRATWPRRNLARNADSRGPERCRRVGGRCFIAAVAGRPVVDRQCRAARRSYVRHSGDPLIPVAGSGPARTTGRSRSSTPR